MAKIVGEMGLRADLATRLASATVHGAGRPADESDESVGELRAEVTSPGGTTQAALEILMGIGGIEASFRSALHAAKERKPAIICVGIASPCAMLKQRRGIEKSRLYPNFGGNKRVAIYC